MTTGKTTHHYTVYDQAVLAAGAAFIAACWAAVLQPTAIVETAQGAVANAVISKQEHGEVLGKDDQAWLAQAKAAAPAPKHDLTSTNRATATDAPNDVQAPPSPRRKRRTHLQFAPPTSSASELVLSTAINSHQVPEPDDTLLPGQDFPEVQGKPTDIKVGSKQDRTKAMNSGTKPTVARLPSVGDPPGCKGENHCINFGGEDGFPYYTATDLERAAFRAVIARFARKGDSVTIQYMENTEAQIPSNREQARVACRLWQGIQPDVDVATCVANDNYIKERIHTRSRGHWSELTDHLRRSWECDPARREPRTGEEVPRLNPDFRAELRRRDIVRHTFDGPNTVPYLEALAAALEPKRLQRGESIIRAVVNHCEMKGARSLDLEELDGGSGFLRNYPQDANDPREQYYLREPDDYGLVAKAFEADADNAPDEWDGGFNDDPRQVLATSK